MKKRILSGLTAFVICAIMLVSPLSMPAYAVTAGSDSGVGNLWNEFKNSEYSTVDDFLNNNITDFRSGSFGSERGGTFGTPKRYYRGSSSGSTTTTTPTNNTLIRTVYESGQTVYTPIVTEHKTYNTTTNTYDYHYTYNDFITNTTNISNYDITNIEYSPTYNLYKLTTNITNYYVSNNYTYVTVIYNNSETNENICQDLYYELPDGRNSFDLTADDVFGEYFIYNVKNYNQVLEDDGTTLGLYHLDGSFANSSAQNNEHNLVSTQFSFDEGIFNSALTQTVSDASLRKLTFDITNVNTIEFFYYISSSFYKSATDVVKDSTPRLDWLKFKEFDAFPSDTDNFGDVWYKVPADTWNHISLVRQSVDSNVFDFYLNGVLQGDCLFSGSISNYSVYYYGWTSGAGYKWYGMASPVIQIDELRLSSSRIYTSNFAPPQQSFDTNSVLVLPDTANENDIYVKSKYQITNYRVGGVRPTYPTTGYVYIYLEDDVVKDVQQYQQDGWYSVDARLYADGEFVDLKEYNMAEFTFIGDDSDDSGDSGDNDDIGDSGNSGGSTDDSDTDFSVIGKLVKLITGFLGELFDSVLGGILDLVNILIDNLRGLLDSFTGITGLIGSLFGFFPSDMVSVLTIGLSAIFILAIIKMFKG